MTTIHHPLAPEDEPVIASMRAMLEPLKGKLLGTSFREPFLQIMESVEAAPDVTGEAGVVGGVPGWWCHPRSARPNAAILYLHGGAYIAGAAYAHRHLAGQLAHRTEVDVFLPDYRLAPEHRFPAAADDAWAAWRGLAQGASRHAVVGDSAGGGLALGLLAMIAARASDGAPVPRAAAVMSPTTDLAGTGPSMRSRAEADFILTEEMGRIATGMYLNGHDPADPLVSPLYGDLTGLPPLRIDVGDAEILLDDSTRYAERASAAGADVTLAIWAGMPHVFPSRVEHLRAANAALDAIGAFLVSHLGSAE